MEQQTLVLWILGIFIPAFIAWAAWITNKTQSNSVAIAVNTANDTNVTEELEKIYEEIKTIDKKSEERFKELGQRIDSLFGTELGLMKSILLKNGQ
jgi:tetrahydromethanopterin S-methyltransferase subunit G